ncbi:hypothetical protein D3C73_1209250 [compost metagenome]
MTFAGDPKAIELGGKLFVTTELTPITQLSPIFTGPIMHTPAPISTLSPIIGDNVSVPSIILFPMVVECRNIQFFPIIAFSLITNAIP